MYPYQSIVPKFQANRPSPGPAANTGVPGWLKAAGPRKTALIVLAHPDDEIFLSGTAALLARQGCKVQFIYATSGEQGVDRTRQSRKGTTLAEARKQELRQALNELGNMPPPIFLDQPDGQVQASAQQIRQRLQGIVANTRPDLIFTFGRDGITGHPDHADIGRITDDVARAAGKESGLYHVALSERSLEAFKQVFGDPPPPEWRGLQSVAKHRLEPEVPLPEDVLVNKLQAFSQHESQFNPQTVENLCRFYLNIRREEFTKA